MQRPKRNGFCCKRNRSFTHTKSCFMKKILFLAAFATLCSFHAFAQTKRIAHRSHNGSAAGLLTEGDGNFGATPEMIARWQHEYDSIRRSDSIAHADSMKNA